MREGSYGLGGDAYGNANYTDLNEVDSVNTFFAWSGGASNAPLDSTYGSGINIQRSTGGEAHQLAFTYQESRMFLRAEVVVEDGLFDPWSEVYHEAHPPSWSEITGKPGAAKEDTVGSYAMLSNISGSIRKAGDEAPASGLAYASAGGEALDAQRPTGTWRCMGYASGYDPFGSSNATLWVKVS